MEKISYDEAREWFWVRTGLWFLIAAIVSVMALFGYSAGIVKVFSVRIWVSLIVGIAMPLTGLTAAALSIQFPWTRTGWKLGFLLNAPTCAAISAAMGFLICGVVLSIMQNDPTKPPSAETINIAYSLMQFGIAGSALWGFIQGAWFTLRRDKYFIEPI